MTGLRENLAIIAFWIVFYAYLWACYQVGSL